MVIKKNLLFSLLIEVYLKCFFVELYMKRAIHKKNVYSTSQWFTAIRSSQWSPSSEPWDSSNSSLDTQRGLYVTNLQLYLPTYLVFYVEFYQVQFSTCIEKTMDENQIQLVVIGFLPYGVIVMGLFLFFFKYLMNFYWQFFIHNLSVL